MVRHFAAVVIAAALLVAPSTGGDAELCAGLTRPLHGPVQREFAPMGRYSGHWGVDWVVPEGTEVRAAGAGTVTFAGPVAGNLTLTVDHGGGLRTSYSYLSVLLVENGDHVAEATTLGASGGGHGTPALHFSVRVGSAYVDPLRVVGCRFATLSHALRLVPVRETW